MSATSLTSLAECFAWCMLQVTLFAAAALCVYGLVRREMPERNVLLLAGSLGIVGLMTLTFVSPWPRWDFVDRSPSTTLLVSQPTVLHDDVPLEIAQ